LPEKEKKGGGAKPKATSEKGPALIILRPGKRNFLGDPGKAAARKRD